MCVCCASACFSVCVCACVHLICLGWVARAAWVCVLRGSDYVWKVVSSHPNNPAKPFTQNTKGALGLS